VKEEREKKAAPAIVPLLLFFPPTIACWTKQTPYYQSLRLGNNCDGVVPFFYPLISFCFFWPEGFSFFGVLLVVRSERLALTRYFFS